MKKPRFTDMHKYPVPYQRSASTDIAKTFKRERDRLKALADAQALADAEAAQKAIPIKRAAK